MSSPSTYFTDVLRGLGASPQAIQGALPFLLGWGGREGVPQNIDPYNMLGTTLPVGGSHGTNGPGVQAYNSYSDGVAATIRMLQQGNFTGIRNMLLSGNPNAYRNDPSVQSEFRSWSGGGYTWPTGGSPPALPAGNGGGGGGGGSYSGGGGGGGSAVASQKNPENALLGIISSLVKAGSGKAYAPPTPKFTFPDAAAAKVAQAYSPVPQPTYGLGSFLSYLRNP